MEKIHGGELGELNTGGLSECSLDFHGKKHVCSTKEGIALIKQLLEIPDKLTAKQVIDTAKKILKVDSESAIYDHPKIKVKMGFNRVKNILDEHFKPEGPKDNTQLLNNFDIDNNLKQWASKSEQEFNKKVLHIPFQMRDFLDKKTELATLDIYNLIKQGYNAFYTIFNTDVSTGPGKHWFALYAELKSDQVQLEYFNSSGYPPMEPLLVWMENTCYCLLKQHGIKCNIVYATKGHQLQNSKTECGVWSLVYILSRLKDKDPHWILTVGANDKDMINYRKRLFR